MAATVVGAMFVLAVASLQHYRFVSRSADERSHVARHRGRAYAATFSFAYVSVPAGAGALLLFGAVQATMVTYGLFRGDRLSSLVARTDDCHRRLAVLVAPGASAPSLKGALLMLTAGFAWGVYSVLGRGTADPLAVTAGNFPPAVPIAACLSLCGVLFDTNLSATGIVCAILSGAIASRLGYGRARD
jgi:hypothetical protein